MTNTTNTTKRAKRPALYACGNGDRCLGARVGLAMVESSGTLCTSCRRVEAREESERAAYRAEVAAWLATERAAAAAAGLSLGEYHRRALCR